MDDVAGERRAALRVPVHGMAVCYGDNLPVHGTIENLSSTGALINMSGTPAGATLELELKLGASTSRVTARSVRVEHGPQRTRIALRFGELDADVRADIDAAIVHALIAAERRPVLVIDDNQQRQAALVRILESQGMSPVSARTPLDAIEILSSPHLNISVALLAPSFGHSLDALRCLVADSFPWVRAAEITDDIFSTLEAAHAAWGPRLGRAIA